MIPSLHITRFYITGILFLVAAVCAILFEQYYIFLFPPAALLLFMAVTSADRLIYLTAFLVPISVTIHNLGFGGGLNLPTEPIIILLMLVAVMKFIYEGFGDKAFLKHPVTIAIMIHLGWLLLCSVTSTMPVVSFKFLLARTWFIVVFYFFASKLFYHFDNIKKFLWAFIIPAIIIVCVIMVRHSAEGFSRDSIMTLIQPFFWIHGVYSAMVAMLVPIMFLFFLKGKDMKISAVRRGFLAFFTLIFIMAVVYSYTRAAWVSLLGAGAVMAVLLFRIRLSIIYSALLIGIAGVLYFQSDIQMELSRNKTGSNSKNMEKHLESATNIKNDPSNLERLNRWSCAWRMFKDKPLLGFGPGTYMFQYAPYQLSYEKTVISTNFATLGHAHSEFLGPLAESGLIGMLTWFAVYVIVFLKALHLIYHTKKPEIRFMVMALFLGLLTYFIHGFLNSYFDYDKIAVPFWAFVAVIVCQDIREKKEKAETL